VQAYRIHNLVIAADIKAEAGEFYLQEIGGDLPDIIDELSPEQEVECDAGDLKTIRDRINEEMDNRNAWLRMGVPCELHWPFVVGRLPRT